MSNLIKNSKKDVSEISNYTVLKTMLRLTSIQLENVIDALDEPRILNEFRYDEVEIEEELITILQQLERSFIAEDCYAEAIVEIFNKKNDFTVGGYRFINDYSIDDIATEETELKLKNGEITDNLACLPSSNRELNVSNWIVDIIKDCDRQSLIKKYNDLVIKKTFDFEYLIREYLEGLNYNEIFNSWTHDTIVNYSIYKV